MTLGYRGLTGVASAALSFLPGSLSGYACTPSLGRAPKMVGDCFRRPAFRSQAQRHPKAQPTANFTSQPTALLSGPQLVVRLTIHGDKDRRLEVGPWSLDVVAYVVAVLLRREP